MHITITPSQAIADQRAANDEFDAQHGNRVNTNRSLDYWHAVGNHMAMREPSCAECAGDAAAQAIAAQQTEEGRPFAIYVEYGRTTEEHATLASAAARTIALWDASQSARLILWDDANERRHYINPRNIPTREDI